LSERGGPHRLPDDGSGQRATLVCENLGQLGHDENGDVGRPSISLEIVEQRRAGAEGQDEIKDDDAWVDASDDLRRAQRRVSGRDVEPEGTQRGAQQRPARRVILDHENAIHLDWHPYPTAPVNRRSIQLLMSIDGAG
jgi:hypothetical protein